MKKIRAYWESLDVSLILSKRELVLGLTTCVLAGIVFGVFLGPKKAVTFGSYNGNHNNSGKDCDTMPEEAED